MEAEVGGLRQQLDKERRRFKQMQSDLQRELNAAFDDNNKLSALLEGKVPKSKTARRQVRWTSVCVCVCSLCSPVCSLCSSSGLRDSVELERTVSNLSSELLASREAEEALRDQLAQLQVLPDQVQNLMKQVLVPDLLLSHVHAGASR